MKRYFGKISLGGEGCKKEYELEMKGKNHVLKFINNIIDLSKLKPYVKMILYSNAAYFNKMLDEVRREFILRHRLPEDVHEKLGESIEIGLDRKCNVVDMHLSNHSRRPIEDWYAFSKDTEVPYSKLKEKIKEIRAGAE